MQKHHQMLSLHGGLGRILIFFILCQNFFCNKHLLLKDAFYFAFFSKQRQVEKDHCHLFPHRKPAEFSSGKELLALLESSDCWVGPRLWWSLDPYILFFTGQLLVLFRGSHFLNPSLSAPSALGSGWSCDIWIRVFSVMIECEL